MAETRRRLNWIVPAVIIVSSVLGGVAGPLVSDANAATSEDEISSAIRTFSKVYDAVEKNFADKVTSDKAVYKGAIPGMLRTLDPHSSFFDPRDFQQMREDQRGHYYGVGMTVSERNRRTVVIAPFPGSPAYKAGIRPGDTIISVQDKRTDGLTTTEVADILKGPKGTPVQVVVMRDGVDKPLTFNIIRDEIPRKSVQDAFFVKPGVLYIDIESFNENTSREVEDNFKRVGEQNVKALILDLRENPGGLLNEGVSVAGRFLQNGQTVVSHRGRASAERPYVARNGSSKRTYPIVVMVNRYSASAAEIVAGALQDHDRGWIIGDNTFGKGLVQTVHPMSDSTGLALTTAKYYTPSNRSIQRDYQNTSFLDYYYRRDTATQNPNDVKMTDSGRTVYGGGGIKPDEAYTPARANKFQSELIRRFVFFSYTAKYFGGKEAKLPQGWDPDAAVMNDFKAFLTKENVPFTEAEWTENLDWTKLRVKNEMYLTAFGQEEARKLAIETDPAVVKAIESVPKAKELLDSAKKLIVQRTSPRNEQ
ncbi:MAG: S41 family peptidase [Acidobacteria bacterium]|nr:S41 family peptidase [Acidobacteriota bacterium]